jgi:hypothetical protein
MRTSRREFLQACGAIGTAAWLAPAMAQQKAPTAVRTYHLTVIPHAPEPDPGLLEAVQHAGVTDLWLGVYGCGTWYFDLERTKTWRKRIEARGMRAHVLTMPLGHPGFGLPKHWRAATAIDGKQFTGTSLHRPATEDTCEALRQMAAAGVQRVFVDDDFRLAAAPGQIGGCFCPEHKQAFLQRHGYGEAQWRELLEAIAHRALTPVLRAWVEFNCDQLTESFRAQQKAAPGIQLGIMVMFFGSEKGGIRLIDYRGAPMRVGENRFDDASFASIEAKVDELFSSLFHRRFVTPELAFSETTAYPEKQLSLKNKVAKLAVATLSDVRNTMFMCDFPKEDWPTLGPAMKRHADIHARIAGHAARGPLKHYWGEASRYVGDDNPYSMFLALGIPFEVTGEPAADGFTFLSDADAQTVGATRSPGTVWVARPANGRPAGVRILPDSLPGLYALKRELRPQLERVPHVENEVPVVCAWYPTARAVVLWNLGEHRVEPTLRYGSARRTIGIDGLDVALIEDVAV